MAKEIWESIIDKALANKPIKSHITIMHMVERGKHLFQLKQITDGKKVVAQLTDGGGKREVESIKAGAFLLAELMFFGADKEDIESVKKSDKFRVRIFNE